MLTEHVFEKERILMENLADLTELHDGLEQAAGSRKIEPGKRKRLVSMGQALVWKHLPLLCHSVLVPLLFHLFIDLCGTSICLKIPPFIFYQFCCRRDLVMKCRSPELVCTSEAQQTSLDCMQNVTHLPYSITPKKRKTTVRFYSARKCVIASLGYALNTRHSVLSLACCWYVTFVQSCRKTKFQRKFSFRRNITNTLTDTKIV